MGFDDEELTIEKIKDACLKHFARQTGSNVVCDVLAGEKGLSCSHIKQVPDLKLIYVRFISGRSCARASRSNTISVIQMLKLGKVVESPEVVNLFQFDMNRMTWSTIRKPVEFNISKNLLGEGAFRRAYTYMSFRSGTCLI